MDNNTPRRDAFMTTKMMLFIRILVGGYLLYLVWGIKDGVFEETGVLQLVLIAAMVIFTVIGILLMVHSARNLLKGHYIGGEDDPLKEQETQQTEERNTPNRITFDDTDVLPEEDEK